MKLYGVNTTSKGEVVLKDTPLGKGGEGSVYAVSSHNIPNLPSASKLVAKMYHDPSLDNRKGKVKAMVQNPVTDDSLAWPLAIILNEQSKFQGYLMTKLSSDSFKEWLYLSNASNRLKVSKEFDVKYALVTVRNLASAMQSVHESGHRIGDVNESNIFVSVDTSVLIVDTDSMQIKDPSGKTFPCLVGKAEYTAAELTQGPLRDHERTVESDYFAFAVAAHQMMTGGATPHVGAFNPNDPNDPPSTVEKIRKGITPGLNPAHARKFGLTPKTTVPSSAIPQFLKKFMMNFLKPDPNARIVVENGVRQDLDAFIHEADAAIARLVQCSQVKTHWYEASESRCPWCVAAQSANYDPWADPKAQPRQRTLTPVKFNDSNETITPKRANMQSTPQHVQKPSYSPTPAPNLHTVAVNNIPGGHPVGTPIQATPAQQSPAVTPAQQSQNPYNPAPPVKQAPDKWKGKIVLHYPDGTARVRPKLSVLRKENPKLWAFAIREETPNLIKAWWSIKRPLATMKGLWFGLAISLLTALFSIGLGFFVSYFMNFTVVYELIVAFLALLSGLTSFIFSLSLFFSALKDRIKTKKKYGNLDFIETEKASKTALRFIPVGIFYGLPFGIAILGLLSAVLTFLSSP